MADPRLDAVIRMIDEANGRDPGTLQVSGAPRPAALAYGERMSEALARIAPTASPHLKIAARGQHIERWKVPRESYGEGRTAYLKWRKDLQAFHANRLGELMEAAGYGSAERARVCDLVRKVGLKSDPEVQALEDAACLVFLAHHAPDLFARYDDEKVVDILKKTARKMSEKGLAAAGELQMGERESRLLGLALER